MSRTAIALIFVCLTAAGCLPRRTAVAVGTPARMTCLDVIGDASIRWIQPDDSVQRRQLQAHCSTVGPAVVREVGPKPKTQSPLPFAIVTWNNHVGGGDLPGFVTALRRGEFTSGLPVDDFVLLLQEVFREGADVPVLDRLHVEVPKRIEEHPPIGGRRDIVETARALGLSLYYAPSMRNGIEGPAQDKEDRGNAILSTLPLANFVAIELPFERQRRVALAATITGTNATGQPWQLRVATSHLDASTTAKHLWLFASQLRARQATSLAAALDDGLPTVVGSDLNTWSGGPREPAVSVLLRAFPDTPTPAMRPTFRSGLAQLALDYLLFRFPDGWTGSTRRVDNRFGSDHYPLIAEIRTSEVVF
jgi:endonuclease/exonuclease/phosphatase family metal-dependent hydrolase